MLSIPPMPPAGVAGTEWASDGARAGMPLVASAFSLVQVRSVSNQVRQAWEKPSCRNGTSQNFGSTRRVRKKNGPLSRSRVTNSL